MNHASDRASPGGSTAFSRHCKRRCVLRERACPFRRDRPPEKRKLPSRSPPSSIRRARSRANPPECSRLDFDHVANDQPFEFRERRSLEPRVCRGDRRILAHHEHAFHFSVGHVVEVFEERMVPGDLRDPVVAEVVFGRCVLAVVRLQQADEVGRKIMPETSWLCLMRQVIAQRLFGAVTARHRQITRQNIVERRNVGRALNRSVTAQGQNAAARADRCCRAIIAGSTRCE